MRTHCELKFKDDLEVKTIQFLTQKKGFSFHSKNYGNWTIYRKPYVRISAANARMLADECNRICEPFYGATGFVKATVLEKLYTHAKSKYNLAFREWVEEWTRNNVEDLDDDQLPF